MKHTKLALLGVTLMFASTEVGQLAGQKLHAIAKLDHFYVHSSRAEELFTFLRDQFELPEAWVFTNFGTHTSGGLSLGNAVLEVIRFPDTSDKQVTSFEGLAFAPVGSAQTIANWLDKIGLAHAPPRPRRLGSAVRVTYENVFLQDFPPRGVKVFVYDPKDREAERIGRLRVSDELSGNGGGPLGVLGVREIVIGLRDYEPGLQLWTRLLGKVRLTSPGLFQFSDGPMIRLVPSGQDQIRALVLEVSALDHASAYLKAKGLLGEETGTSVTIAAASVQGLRILLEQHRPMTVPQFPTGASYILAMPPAAPSTGASTSVVSRPEFYRITFGKTNFFMIQKNGHVAIEGTYTSKGDHLTLVESSIPLSSRPGVSHRVRLCTGPGVYTWKVQDRALVLAVVNDDCAVRGTFLTLQPWRKAEN